MAIFNPYLNFPGNTEEVFNLYKSVFGGEFAVVMRYRDTGEADKISEADLDKIMHMALPVKGSVIMGTDVTGEMAGSCKEGNNMYISVNAENKAEADKFYTGLAERGNAYMPMQHTFWGDYFGMLKDKFGTQWMISFNEQQTQ